MRDKRERRGASDQVIEGHGMEPNKVHDEVHGTCWDPRSPFWHAGTVPIWARALGSTQATEKPR